MQRFKIEWLEISPERNFLKGMAEFKKSLFAVEVSDGNISYTRETGQKSLPEMTQEEKQRIDNIIACYYKGMKKSLEIVTFLPDKGYLQDNLKRAFDEFTAQHQGVVNSADLQTLAKFVELLNKRL